MEIKSFHSTDQREDSLPVDSVPPSNSQTGLNQKKRCEGNPARWKVMLRDSGGDGNNVTGPQHDGKNLA